jgi:ubiquinone/menaquinone biosynthesis C-methylase UbiE
MRFELKSLPYESVGQSSALYLPFDDDLFDIVFSHGVLHHIPEIDRASAEIARVLRPDGELVVMLYAKRSLNYLVSIFVLRRLALLFFYVLGSKRTGILGHHLANARKLGIWKYLSMKNFIHANTDGPQNPYSKVYDTDEVRRDFAEFEIVRSYQNFMHAPPLKVDWLPLERILGWHLWVHLKPKK